MKQPKHISLGPFNWDGFVFLGGTEADVHKWFHKHLKIDFSEGIRPEHQINGLAWVEANQPWYIWVKDPHNVPTLAHEALHITARVLRDRGLSLTVESEEAYTYVLGSIMSQSLK